jgi:ATP-dependent Clp protease ATP-binding subunit ClpB
MSDSVSIQNIKQRLEEIQFEITQLNAQKQSLSSKWMAEKSYIHSIRNFNEQIENAKSDSEQYERQGDLAKVAEIRYGIIRNLENNIKSAKEQLNILQRNGKMLKEEVDAEDIASILGKQTGIPVQKMLETERIKLLKIEERIHNRLIGQEDAVTAISNAIRRSRAGLQDTNKPIGSFIFLGSTGVGKTEMAKALAEFLFDDENALVRIDMSEYMEKFSVSKLIGAPPGYIGYDEGGQLTEAIRRRPYSVVLLDEIEKANIDVFNILLQVLDDGRLTDGKGRTVNFKNTIIIMTSNLGSEVLSSKLEMINENNRDKIMALAKNELYDILKKTLRPEFLNRIDEIIIFNPLTSKEIISIAKLHIVKLIEKMRKLNIDLNISNDALAFISQKGFDPIYGARPLKRVIQKYLTDELSVKLLSNEFISGDKVTIDYNNSRLLFKKAT